jgi:hypothetical protein
MNIHDVSVPPSRDDLSDREAMALFLRGEPMTPAEGRSLYLRGLVGRMLPLIFVAVTGCSAPGCAGTSQVVQRQEPAALACLPVAFSHVLACAGDHACIIGALGELVVCWVTHQTPAPAPAPAPASSSSVVQVDQDAHRGRARAGTSSSSELGELAAPRRASLELGAERDELQLELAAEPALAGMQRDHPIELLLEFGALRCLSGELALQPAHDLAVALAARRDRLGERDDLHRAIEPADAGAQPELELEVLSDSDCRHRAPGEVPRCERHRHRGVARDVAAAYAEPRRVLGFCAAEHDLVSDAHSA